MRSVTPNNPGKVTTPLIEEWIGRLAASQHGHVTRAQLLAAGLTAKAIEYRLATGRLIQVHRGVYAVGHRPPSPQSRAMAAVLACGPGAVLSHHSAATLWGIEPRWRAPLEVTARGKRSVRGVKVHRSQTLTPRDTTVHYGIPITSPARTLLDLAGVLRPDALARAVNEARIARILSLDDLADLLTRSPGRATTALAPFVKRRRGPTRSEFEDRFLAFIDDYGLPQPEINARVAGYEVDAVWRAQRLVVELDSREFHDADQPFEHDRDKDADLLMAGFPVVRITWDRLVNKSAREAARLAALLTPERLARLDE